MLIRTFARNCGWADRGWYQGDAGPGRLPEPFSCVRAGVTFRGREAAKSGGRCRDWTYDLSRV